MLRDSFPALRSVAAISTSSFLIYGPWQLPLLHVVTVGRPIPRRLKKIVVQNRHYKQNNHCCKWGVGTSEVVGPEQRLPWCLSGLAELTIREQRLPELLSELVELTIRLDECGDPERCARYIWSVLPGMRDVLRFQYRARERDAWKPYTLPVAM